jgi:hypothetical protein
MEIEGNTKMSTEQLDELSNDTLASYKKKAGQQASTADKMADTAFAAGKMDQGKHWTNLATKKFRQIVKATNKQFANDKKLHEEVIGEDAARDNMTRVMDKIAPEKRDAARKTYSQARKTMGHAAAINIVQARHCEEVEHIEELSKQTLNKLGNARFKQAEDSFDDEERETLIRKGNKAINRKDSAVTPSIKSEEIVDENLHQSSVEGPIARGTNKNLGPVKKQMGNKTLVSTIANILKKEK